MHGSILEEEEEIKIGVGLVLLPKLIMRVVIKCIITLRHRINLFQILLILMQMFMLVAIVVACIEEGNVQQLEGLVLGAVGGITSHLCAGVPPPIVEIDMRGRLCAVLWG